ncbi:hypothetical protein AABB24_009500 [Solanum stoloniferum]|uniref:Uncharacterized protein n=1 Tax=Solanum stoloniferum TaxID=62892 RepID=A0ABD2ULB5_9SOLN
MSDEVKVDDVWYSGILKKFLKGVNQLYFEFVNKVLLLRTEKRNAASSTDLLLMEMLDMYETINLPGLMLEHMHRIMTGRDGKHGTAYGYFLNKVFEHFNTPIGKEIAGTMKHAFSMSTLIECECIDGKVKDK